jgi:hypothetical protein
MCQILGWSVLVRVDGLTYSFLGDVVSNLVNGTVNSSFFGFGPANTLLTGQAGPMQVNLTFFSPIEVRSHSSVTFNLHMQHIKPEDWVKQSIPFSYLSFSASSSDSRSHAVQVYSDVSGGKSDRYSEARRSSLASLQSGTRETERRTFCGTRRPIPMLFSIVSHSRHRQRSWRYSTKRNGVRYIML